MKRIALACAVCTASALFAAPVARMEPVAAGFPAWQGVTPKNHVLGREITPGDLRHRVAVVVEVEPGANLRAQLLKAAGLVKATGHVRLGHGSSWETAELPRDVIVLVSIRGGKDPEAVAAALKSSGKDDSALADYRSAMVPFYDDVTFAGGPETAGKRPYIYVMGPAGTEPLAQGALNDAGVKAALAAVRKGKAMVSAGDAKWRRFYGTADPSHFPALEKAIAKERPLNAVAAAILKDVASKDAERAREAQVVYDALAQARGDLVFRIRLEAAACPHRAYYDFQQLVRYWPSERKKVEDAMARAKSVPDASRLAQVFCKTAKWSDPEFVCKSKGEAASIVKELQKMKASLAKLKESKVIAVQNGAQVIDAQIDELVSTIPDRVAGK